MIRLRLCFFGRNVPAVMLCPSQNIMSGGTGRLWDPSLAMLILIVWLRWYLPGFAIVRLHFCNDYLVCIVCERCCGLCNCWSVSKCWCFLRPHSQLLLFSSNSVRGFGYSLHACVSQTSVFGQDDSWRHKSLTGCPVATLKSASFFLSRTLPSL